MNRKWIAWTSIGGAALVAAQGVAQDPSMWRVRQYHVAQRPVTPAAEPEAPPENDPPRRQAPARTAQPPATQGGDGISANLNRDLSQSGVEILNQNSLLILGPDEQARAIKQLVLELDRIGAIAEPAIEVVPLEHAESASLAHLLTSVYAARNDARGPEGATPGAPAGAPAAAASQGKVGFIGVAQPNAVIVISRKADLDQIVEFVREMDLKSRGGEQFKIIRLRIAPAAQIAAKLNQFFADKPLATGTAAGTTGPAGLRTKVEVVADERTNSLIVYAGPSDMLQAEQLIKRFDQSGTDVAAEVRYFKLKNAAADQVADLLQQTVLRRSQAASGVSSTTGGAAAPTGGGGGGNFGGAGGGGGGPGGGGPGGGGPGGGGGQGGFGQAGFGAQAGGGGAASSSGLQTPVKSSKLQLRMPANAKPGEIIESGILEDITVTADRRTNSLLVTAPKDSMTLVAELIQQLDAQPNPIAELKVFPLLNADVNAMLTTLRQFFTNQDTTGGGGGGGNAANTALPPVFGLAGIEPQLSLIPLSFSVDTRTNSLLAYGSPNDILVVEALVTKLDNNTARERKNFVYRLNSVTATDAATALQSFIQAQATGGGGTTTGGAGGAGGGGGGFGGAGAGGQTGTLSVQQQIANDVVVVAEPTTNQLLISASPRYFDEILRIVQTIDRRPPQVVIQVLIAEVTLQDDEEFGVELGAQSKILFERSITTNNSLDPGVNFNSTSPLGNNPLTAGGNVGLQSLSNFSLGRGSPSQGFGGLILSASSENVSVLLRALKRQQRLDVLSRPQIMAVDNRQANLLIGQQVPLITTNTVSALGNLNNSYTYKDVGIILIVQPQINPDGTIVMRVNPQVSSLDTGGGVATAVSATGTVLANAPIINTTNIDTTVTAADGQTVVLGGLITRQRSRDSRKIPILGDLPHLGWLFRTEFYNVTKRELLIILTPRIVYCDADVERVKAEEGRRIDWCLPDVRAVHGDPYAPGLPDPNGNDHCTTPLGTAIPESAKLPPTALTPRLGVGGYPATMTPVPSNGGPANGAPCNVPGAVPGDPQIIFPPAGVPQMETPPSVAPPIQTTPPTLKQAGSPTNGFPNVVHILPARQRTMIPTARPASAPVVPSDAAVRQVMGEIPYDGNSASSAPPAPQPDQRRWQP